jgi:signal peptidase II
MLKSLIFRNYRCFWMVASLGLFLDQLSKKWIVNAIPFGKIGLRPVPIYEPIIYLVHAHNTGAAWSLFQGKSPYLIIIAVVVLAFLFLARKQLSLINPSAQIIFGCLVGGIFGNLLDRILHGYVIDFIDIHIGSLYRWPAFNVADSLIVVSVVVYVVREFRRGYFLQKQPPPEFP